jgi:carboxyl-terminal processing protease
MRFRLLPLLLVTLLVSAAGSAETKQQPGASRVETFETVWRIVDEKFYDPSFNGVDWRAVRERYAPRVAAVKSDAELYELLNEMLGELKASHFGIVPPQSLLESSASPDDASWGGTTGMTVRVVGGEAVVTEVEPDGGAARAGIRPGFVVTRAGSLDVAEAIRRASTGGVTEPMRRFLVRRAIAGALGGMHGSRVEVAYRDGSDQPGTANVVRREVTGKPMRFGQLPTFVTQVESKRLPGNVGYLRFNVFLPPMMEAIRGALRDLRSCDAIVLDLRGNPGGVGIMAPAVAALFLDEETSLGTMKMRRGEIRFVTYRQGAPYEGLLLLLVDEASASTSEILAGALQEMGRAAVVGERTLGAVLPSVVEKLPNGAVFQYAVADFKTPNGVMLEGRGVLPDVLVTPTRRDFLAGRDPALGAAIDHVVTLSRKAVSARR